MYIPVHDYMKPVEDDYKKFLKYLKEQYPKKKIYSETSKSLEKLHRILWVLYIIKGTLFENNEYFNDIFTTTLAIINSSVIKDKKSLNFLIRNTIESFLKFSKIFYNDINVKDHPRDLFSNIFEDCRNNSLIHLKYEKIKSYYSSLSNVVHGNNIANTKMSICLKEYDNICSLSEIKGEIDDFYKFITYIVFIYLYTFPDKLKMIKDDKQYILRDFIPSEDLKIITAK